MGLPSAFDAGVLVKPEEIAFAPDAEINELETPAGGSLLELPVVLRVGRSRRRRFCLRGTVRASPAGPPATVNITSSK